MNPVINLTPNRNVINGVNAPLLENTMNQNRKKQQSKQSLIWGIVNIGLLSIISYDLTYICPLYVSYFQYMEYICACILILNILYHFGRYLKLKLMGKQFLFMPTTNSYLNVTQPGTPSNKVHSTPVMNTPNISLSNTPMNMTALSWMSSSTPNESCGNYPVKSDSWLYSHGSPRMQNTTPVKTPRQDTSGINFISNEDSLTMYLKDFETNEKIVNLSNASDTSNNILSSYWSHPITKNSKDATSILKRCQYQLSSPIVVSSSNSPQKDDKASPHGAQSEGMETWRRLSIDIVTLTQWNANLRMWLSQTILARLTKEFENIDDALAKQGLSDIQIGKVGLDRIRKTAQTSPVLQFIPTLSTIILFLEVTPNQEYLVKRIKELAKAGCMSEFKWSSGGSFNGKEWDTSLPSDSTIMMHLFITYLDTQLLPLPSHPDLKPFSGHHYLKHNEKLPQLTENTMKIQEYSDYPPHYRVIIGEDIHELVKGYNNFFHTILLFLYYVNKKEHGMIGRVNLGKSGLNMLWIIQS